MSTERAWQLAIREIELADEPDAPPGDGIQMRRSTEAKRESRTERRERVVGQVEQNWGMCQLESAMSIAQENAPIFVARCDTCGAKGPWSATPTEAIRLAKQDGWHVRKTKILSESTTLCVGCKPRRQPR